MSGLATAKTFHTFGHDVTVYERGGHVGDVWAPEKRYPGEAAPRREHDHWVCNSSIIRMCAYDHGLPLPSDSMACITCTSGFVLLQGCGYRALGTSTTLPIRVGISKSIEGVWYVGAAAHSWGGLLPDPCCADALTLPTV